MRTNIVVCLYDMHDMNMRRFVYDAIIDLVSIGYEWFSAPDCFPT